jgi:diguanylate cyclase (GGDEF)-like protein
MDIVARLGGDQFAVLQIDAGAGEETAALQRLAAAMATANAAPGRTYELSLSLGAVAFDPAAPCALDELLHLADERMYARKRRRTAAVTGKEGGPGDPGPGGAGAGGADPRSPAAPPR